LFDEAAIAHALQQQYQISFSALCRHACFMLPVKGISALLHPSNQPLLPSFSADLLLLQLQHRVIREEQKVGTNLQLQQRDKNCNWATGPPYYPLPKDMGFVNVRLQHCNIANVAIMQVAREEPHCSSSSAHMPVPSPPFACFQ